MRAGIALGSNMGDRLENLRRARTAILGVDGARGTVLPSAVYATEAVECEEDAGEFLNAVVEIEFEGNPRDLLRNLKAIETSMGRPAAHERNRSRTIDIDLLYVDAIEIRDEDLRVPHPRMVSRRFVLEPLSDIRAELVLPGQEKPVSELLALLPESARVLRLTNDW
jgi:2-amino-4-hydroxy-6-hydroxymethyldihydropteridine diphosphokinase